MADRNYRPMVERNRRICREKEERTKSVIASLLSEGKKIRICDLTELCGVSRSFLYKNESVRSVLLLAKEQQAGLPFPKEKGSGRADTAALARVLYEKDSEIKRLEKENAVLKKKLAKSDLKLLKKL